LHEDFLNFSYVEYQNTSRWLELNRALCFQAIVDDFQAGKWIVIAVFMKNLSIARVPCALSGYFKRRMYCHPVIADPLQQVTFSVSRQWPQAPKLPECDWTQFSNNRDKFHSQNLLPLESTSDICFHWMNFFWFMNCPRYNFDESIECRPDGVTDNISW
jgi:hypothetical protein